MSRKAVIAAIGWLVLANAVPVGAVVVIGPSPVTRTLPVANAPASDALTRAVTAPATLLTLGLGLGFALLMMRSVRQPRTVAF
jgi:hypothetical protein